MKKTIITCAILAFFCCGIVPQANAVETASASTEIVAASDNWDDLLDEYEEYVDQYIKVYKKAMAGDMAALSEYMKLAEKAQSIAKKIEKSKGSMTSAQLQRYLKITKKMADAMK
jgi:hypothetical protein